MSHRFALPIATLLLLAAFLIPSLLGNITVKGNATSNIAIQSNGTISYTSTMLLGVGHPAWSYDPYGNPVDIEALVNLVADTGANCWREAMYGTSSLTGYYTNLKSYCDARGLKFEIQALLSDDEVESDIIDNVGNAQTAWINNWSYILQQLQPYAIMVMNEPSNHGTHRTATAQEFALYRQFCINCINAWRQIKPDLVIIVQNDPFNDLFDSTSYGFAANPLPFSNIIYTRHIYYAYDNTYPPDYLPDQQAYWNGDLATAKQLLTKLIEAESLPLTSKGQRVMWDEFGANLQAPNAPNYIQDFFDICKARNIGAVEYALAPYGWTSGRDPSGILNDDYKTFNAVGQVWAAEMSRS